jgi:hypothetical protein
MLILHLRASILEPERRVFQTANPKGVFVVQSASEKHGRAPPTADLCKKTSYQKIKIYQVLKAELRKNLPQKKFRTITARLPRLPHD